MQAAYCWRWLFCVTADGESLIVSLGTLGIDLEDNCKIIGRDRIVVPGDFPGSTAAFLDVDVFAILACMITVGGKPCIDFFAGCEEQRTVVVLGCAAAAVLYSVVYETGELDDILDVHFEFLLSSLVIHDGQVAFDGLDVDAAVDAGFQCLQAQVFA